MRTGRAIRPVLEAGVAYVSFAVDHPAHFTVMFGPVGHGDPDLAAARDRAGAILDQGVVDLPRPPAEADRHDAAIAAWSLVHGFATWWLNGALSLRSECRSDGHGPQRHSRAPRRRTRRDD
jgi:Tetracyclin repressor-like, C-terminal domain